LLSQNRQHSIGNFLDAHRFHAAEVNRAFAKKAGAAFDMMSQGDVAVAEWASETGFC
jgi:hypothetical protein